MPVTAADLKFFAAATQADAVDGGGPRSSTVLQNGTTEVFPTVSAANRTSGAAKLRKVYPSLTNADNAALFGASVAINEVPSDIAVAISAFAFGDGTTRRAAAVAALESASVVNSQIGATGAGGSVAIRSATVTFSTGGTVVTMPDDSGGTTYTPPAVGAQVRIQSGTVTTFHWVTARTQTGGAGGNTVTVTPVLPTFVSGAQMRSPVYVSGGPRVYGALAVPGSLSSGDTAVTVTDPWVRVVPWAGTGTYPTANNGVNPTPFEASGGRLPAVFAEDVATLWHEAATSPASYSNGQTVNVGRTDLDQMALVDSNGVEVQRWLAGGPTPAGSFATVNLSTGVLTFSNVSGLSQPVTVRHRIAHRSAVSAVAGRVVTLATALTRAFPANAVLSTHLPLGDVQARSVLAFGQQAWTNVWSDTLIGSPSPLQYTGTVTVTNQGAENDRYALIFTAANTFKCYSERLGLIASGNTTTTFAPINPATGAALFSLASSGWATDILVGSVLRFNTVGACPPVWALQCISPSSPAGTTRTQLRIHGTVP